MSLGKSKIPTLLGIVLVSGIALALSSPWAHAVQVQKPNKTKPTPTETQYHRALTRAQELFDLGQIVPSDRALAHALTLIPDGWEANLLKTKLLIETKDFVPAQKTLALASKNAPKPQQTEIQKLKAVLDAEIEKRGSRRTGAVFYKKWEVTTISANRDHLLIENGGIQESQTLLTLAEDQIEAMKALMSMPTQGIYMPLGTQSEFETMADRACEFVKDKTIEVPAISIPLVSYEFGYELPPELAGDNPILGTLISSRLSKIAMPIEKTLTVGAGVITCKDPPKRRFRMAQARAALDFAILWEQALYRKLLKHRGASKDLLLHDRSRRTVTKAVHRQISQLKSYELWVDSREAAFSMELAERKARKEILLKALARAYDRLKSLDSHPSSRQWSVSDWTFLEYIFRPSR